MGTKGSTGRLVAVVDDEEPMRVAIRSLLRSLAFDVAVFGSADDFLSSGCIDEVGCLILDVRIPRKSGLDLQRELITAGRRIPMVFISAHAEDEARRQALNAGALAFLRKPFSNDALIKAVRAALGMTAAGSGGAP